MDNDKTSAETISRLFGQQLFWKSFDDLWSENAKHLLVSTKLWGFAAFLFLFLFFIILYSKWLS